MSADRMDPVSTLDSGPFGRGGHQITGVRMEFFGRLGPAFLDFAIARAHRLELKGWVTPFENRILITVQGPEAMVGAFEMACCIGPDKDEVQDWTCTDTEPNHAFEAFELRETEDPIRKE